MTTTHIIDVEHQMPDLDHSPAEQIQADDSQLEKPTLTKLLRWCGGIALVAASMVFMYQGVSSYSPMMRHWILLGICSLLCILGVFTGTTLRDEKGARTFLAFAASSFPVLSSQLGAMFFSLFGVAPPGMPAPLVYTLANSSMVFMITAVTLAITVPVSYLTFQILARSQALLLTSVFSVANLCILIPLRGGIWLGAILSLLACVLFYYDNFYLRRDFRLENFEGRTARMMLTTPLLIMISRSFFYSMPSSYYGFMLALLGLFFSFHLGRIIENTNWKTVAQVVGQVLMGTGWFLCLLTVFDSLQEPWLVYSLLIPLAAVVMAQSFFCSPKNTGRYQNLAAVIALLSVVATHWLSGSVLFSLVGCLVALMIVAMGVLTAKKSQLTLGTLTALFALGHLFVEVIMVHSNYVWLTLAFLGIGVLLTASFLESKRAWFNLKSMPLWGKLESKA